VAVNDATVYKRPETLKWKSLFTIKQNGSRIEHIKGKKTTKQDSENT